MKKIKLERIITSAWKLLLKAYILIFIGVHWFFIDFNVGVKICKISNLKYKYLFGWHEIDFRWKNRKSKFIRMTCVRFINSEHFNSPWTQPAEPEHGTPDVAEPYLRLPANLVRWIINQKLVRSQESRNVAGEQTDLIKIFPLIKKM